MAEELSAAAAAERARATQHAPPIPKPSVGAELFASLPQIVLFVLMWHTVFGPAREGAGSSATARAGQSASPVGSGLASGGAGGSLDHVSANIEAGGAAVTGIPPQRDIARFPVRYPMWPAGPAGQKFELYVYLASSPDALNYTNVNRNGVVVGDMGALLWYEKDLYLNSGLTEGNARTLNVTLTQAQIPQPWRNESIFAHVFFVRNQVAAASLARSRVSASASSAGMCWCRC